VSACS